VQAVISCQQHLVLSKKDKVTQHIRVLVQSFWSWSLLQFFPCQQGTAKRLTVLSVPFIFLLYTEIKGKLGNTELLQNVFVS